MTTSGVEVRVSVAGDIVGLPERVVLRVGDNRPLAMTCEQAMDLAAALTAAGITIEQHWQQQCAATRWHARESEGN